MMLPKENPFALSLSKGLVADIDASTSSARTELAL